MKTCPRCARTYPDAESFCEDDGTALIATSGDAGTANTVDGREEPIECAVCGGKAEPGEVMCNFCGARLPASAGAEPASSPPPPPPRAPRVRTDHQQPRRPENYVPAQDRLTATQFTPPISPDDEGDEEQRRPLSGAVGYSAAALVALAAGAWLAIHLSSAPHRPATESGRGNPSPDRESTRRRERSDGRPGAQRADADVRRVGSGAGTQRRRGARNFRVLARAACSTAIVACWRADGQSASTG